MKRRKRSGLPPGASEVFSTALESSSGRRQTSSSAAFPMKTSDSLRKSSWQQLWSDCRSWGAYRSGAALVGIALPEVSPQDRALKDQAGVPSGGSRFAARADSLFAVPDAVSRRIQEIAGAADVGIAGTRFIRTGSVQHVTTNGRRRSACSVARCLRTKTGMCPSESAVPSCLPNSTRLVLNAERYHPSRKASAWRFTCPKPAPPSEAADDPTLAPPEAFLPIP
jgi:hypothetical protein